MTPEGTLGVQAKEHPDPGVCGRGGLPDVHLEEVVTCDPEDLEHRVVTNTPENEGPQIAEAPENPLKDVGFLSTCPSYHCVTHSHQRLPFIIWCWIRREKCSLTQSFKAKGGFILLL